jgi:tetratricopeptide (TPR) repeat protein
MRNPSSARNFYLTGKALAQLEKLDLAVKWLKQSVELDPAYAEPRYLLGQVLMKKGLKEEAVREFKAFEEIRAKTPRQRR